MASIERQVQFDIYTKHKTVLFENYDHDGYQPLTDFGIFYQQDKTNAPTPDVAADSASRNDKDCANNRCLVKRYNDYLNEYVDKKHSSISSKTKNNDKNCAPETNTTKDKTGCGSNDYIDGTKIYIASGKKLKKKESTTDYLTSRDNCAGLDTITKVKSSSENNKKQEIESSIPKLPLIPSQKSFVRFASNKPTREMSLARMRSSQCIPILKKGSNWKLVGKVTKVISFLIRPEKRVISRIAEENFEVCNLAVVRVVINRHHLE